MAGARMDAMALADLRARAESLRSSGGEAAATALIELAEAEPILGHRQAVVRGLLEEAARVLDRAGNRALEGRVLLRLGCVKLTEGDLEGSEQLATRAHERLEDDPAHVLETGALFVRVLVRRKRFEDAASRLAALSNAQLADPDLLSARRASALMLLALAELSLEQQHWEDADKHLEVLDDAVTGDDDLVEYRFGCRQARAAVALALGQSDRAVQALRDVVAIAKGLDAAEDEVEARIALAGALVERGEHIGLEEAERHLQNSRDRALEAGLDSLHTAALIGQAGLLAKRGKTKAALDRCIEIARVAGDKKDLARYALAVALMSQIYEQLGDLASAYRTFAEAHASLRESIGAQANDVIVPHITAFANRIGPERFREIAETVNKAAHARTTFRS